VKKTVPFELFNKNEYLMFDILRLAELERALGKSIAGLLVQQEFGIDYVLKALPIAMKQHYHKSSPEFFADKIEKVFENGGTLDEIAVPIIKAILASGSLGKEVRDRALGIIDDEVPQDEKNGQRTPSES
jgi:hypothetical protein